MVETAFDRVESLLKQHSITFQELRHEPVYTSEEAARIRGTPLASGAKALIVKGEEGFIMFVVPADRKLDSHGGLATHQRGSRGKIRHDRRAFISCAVACHRAARGPPPRQAAPAYLALGRPTLPTLGCLPQATPSHWTG